MAKPSDKGSGKKPLFVLTRKTVAGWAAVVFFISAWMFVMGVMVGRGTAPVQFDLDQLRRSIDSLQKPLPPSRKDVPPIESTEMKDKTKLDFYEALPRSREDPEMPATVKVPEAPARQEPPAPKPAAPQVQAKAEKPAPPPPPPSTQAAPGQPYTVQISAARSEAEARELLNKLRQRGYGAYIEPIAIPEKGTWYRVRMGEFPSKEFARSTLERLKKDGFAPVVVPK